MKKVYTLSVLDKEGNVTGTPRTILCASREIMLDESTSSYHDMMQGHGALVESVYDLPKDWDHTPYRVQEGGVFQKCVCAHTPTNNVRKDDAIWIWERIS